MSNNNVIDLASHIVTLKRQQRERRYQQLAAQARNLTSVYARALLSCGFSEQEANHMANRYHARLLATYHEHEGQEKEDKQA
jgi:hypothetical protein